MTETPTYAVASDKDGVSISIDGTMLRLRHDDVMGFVLRVIAAKSRFDTGPGQVLSVSTHAVFAAIEAHQVLAVLSPIQDPSPPQGAVFPLALDVAQARELRSGIDQAIAILARSHPSETSQ